MPDVGNSKRSDLACGSIAPNRHGVVGEDGGNEVARKDDRGDLTANMVTVKLTVRVSTVK